MEETAITVAEIRERQQLVKEINDGLDGVGVRLKRIRDGKLWRGDFDSFKEFVEETFNISDRHANRMISSAIVIENISGPIGPDSLLPNEGQSRELAGLPPAEQVEVWQDVCKTTAKQGRKPTAKDVKATVQKRKPPKKHKEKPAETPVKTEDPHFEDQLVCPLCSGSGKLVKDADIPESLNTTEFQETWAMWKDYRKREKKNALKPTTIKLQLADLEKMGPVKAVAAIKHSMKQGWTGLFQEKKDNGTSRNGRPRTGQGRRFVADKTA